MGELLNELGSLFHSICAEYELPIDPFMSSLSHLSGYEQAYKELLSKALETIKEQKQLVSKQGKQTNSLHRQSLAQRGTVLSVHVESNMWLMHAVY